MNKKPYDLFISIFLILNGISCGHLINLGTIALADKTKITKELKMDALLTAGAALYTAKRARDIWVERNKQNQK